MKTLFVISSASKLDGMLECHEILIRETYEDAIVSAQDSIANDFGYNSWEDYLSHRDPEITERNGVYTIHDDNCGHEEYYRIEKSTI